MSLTTPTLPGYGVRPGFSPLRRLLGRIGCGRLTLSLPQGRSLEITGKELGPAATVQVHRWRALLRLVLRGDLGLALAFRDGDWDSPDLLALLEFGLANQSAMASLINGSRLSRMVSRLAHRARANTRRASRDNIAFHYDLGNDFYRQWLDDSMLYSSALYSDAPDDTLEQAQARRLERIAQMLDTPAGGQVLELGCGWGALAADLAERHGAHVTGLTLSARQLEFARALAERRGVSAQVDLRLQDYRDVQGQFDRIVSIEMIEAVGESYWPTYFSVLRERLKPGGVAVLQAITIADDHFESYRREADFIQRCIFPGGMLPCPRVLQEQARNAGLVIEEATCFGDSYARTLAEWRSRFLAAWPVIEQQGFDARFKRLWTYYLSYCEAGFRAGRIDVGLYRLRRPGA